MGATASTAQVAAAHHVTDWKTNFRNALQSATDITDRGSELKQGIKYRFYQLLDRPDQEKARKSKVTATIIACYFCHCVDILWRC
jgi:hypothetical protein